MQMTDDEAFEEYGDAPLFFSHYYNFIFVYKSPRLDNGCQIFLHRGGSMEKVSAMVVDVEEPLTLNEIDESDYACIKGTDRKLIWKHGNPPD